MEVVTRHCSDVPMHQTTRHTAHTSRVTTNMLCILMYPCFRLKQKSCSTYFQFNISCMHSDVPTHQTQVTQISVLVSNQIARLLTLSVSLSLYVFDFIHQFSENVMFGSALHLSHMRQNWPILLSSLKCGFHL